MKYNLMIGATALVLGLSLSLASCAKDEERAIIAPTSAPTLKLSTEMVTIDADNPTATALDLTWGAAQMGYDRTLVAYELVLRPEGSTQEATLDLGTGVLKYALTYKALSELLLEKLGVEAGTTAKYTIALRAYPFNTSGPKPTGTASTISSPQTITVTTAVILAESPDIFFIGGMFNSEWKNDLTTYPLFLDEPLAKTYTYTGQFQGGGEFKFIHEENLGSWSNLFGADGVGKLSREGNAGNIKDITATGYYTVTLDPVALTYKIEPYADGATAPVYTSISLIGNAVGSWDADVDLTATPYDPHVWRAEGVAISEGELKIRADHAWSKNWGGKAFPKAISDSGDNIKVSTKQAGTYDVMFNDLTGHYHFRKH